MQIYPDIYQLKIPLPDPQLSTLNAYVIKTDEGSMLIDTGWNTSQAYEALKNQLSEIDLTPADLKYVLITHFHPDHSGLIEKLSHDSKAIFIQNSIEHQLLKQRIENVSSDSNLMETWLIQHGLPAEINTELQDLTNLIFKNGMFNVETLLVNGGETLPLGGFNFEIIWTPGHTPGMICLYEATHGLLFSADHVLGNTTPNISLFMEESGDPLGDYLESLRKVAVLPVKLTMPAHGDLILNLSGRVDEIIAHHETRLQEMLAICGKNGCNAYQLASNVSWSMDWSGMSPLNRRFALTETLAHLELLRRRGQIMRTAIGGEFRFHPVI